jgi:hypothetical protein
MKIEHTDYGVIATMQYHCGHKGRLFYVEERFAVADQAAQEKKVCFDCAYVEEKKMLVEWRNRMTAA